ncbi:MAG TPA: acyloxyacyl hydrolase [Thermoanaerobaculia bacterium]|nr:acyloxyacyl hydrolase [Thermoanaerobaculia bacterium]
MIALPVLFVLGFVPKTFTVSTGAGVSQPSWHGQSSFRSIQFEVAGRSRLFQTADVGAALTYSAIRQPRSWFGHRYGDPDDRVRAESMYLFVRKMGGRAFFDAGTGPMWSNRRVPAATSRFNFDTKLGFGLTFAERVRIGYRFSHISNAGVAHRNPGWNVHSVFAGFSVPLRSPGR